MPGGCDEAVSQATLRLDVSRGVGGVPELVPEPADVDPDVVDLVDVLATPDPCQECLVFEDVTGVPHEVIQQLVLGGSQLQPGAMEARLLLREVDLEIPS